MTEMMDIAPKINAGEYLDWLKGEIDRRPRIYSDVDLIEMLRDVRGQISSANPAHKLLDRIDTLLAGLQP
jgi:hypothetical protein